MESSSGITIGHLAAQVGVNVQTIRYYEREGLLPKPPRTVSGYRTFPPSSVDRVRFIKQAQALGFTLREIEELLALRVDPATTCDDVRGRAEAKIADIDRKIESLRSIQDALSLLAGACSGRGSASECSLLQAIQSPQRREQRTSVPTRRNRS